MTFARLLLAAAVAAGAKTSPGVQARLDELAELLAPALKKGDVRRRVAVLDFEDATAGAKKRRLGRTLAEGLAARISKRDDAELVERSALDKVAAELRLSLSGAVDPATAKSVGRMAAADAVVTGTVAELGDYYDVSVRAVTVEDGKVLGAAVVDVEKEAVEGKAKTAPTSEATLQGGIDLLESALMAHARGHIEGFKVNWPKSLDELVPKYLDRLPDAQDGKWVYDPASGTVRHSTHPDLKPIQPRLKLQKLLDEGKKQALRSHLQAIGVAMKVYEAQSGTRPRRLDELSLETPDAFGGKWLYDAKTGVVSHSEFPDLKWTPSGP